ncbi:insulinase family protein [Candidatus Woesearchaeota archaeon]|nr:insulinase family protein [Candidatus Woesearchaeota archaeon]
MQKVVLANGLKIIREHKPGNIVVIEVLVNVGSNDETIAEQGISHFLEHLLFEGTTSRPTNLAISNEIESIGGDFNAYTTNERTCFYIKVLKKYYRKAVTILADILQNSLFNVEHIAREKKIILKEIDMINDEPRFYQWLFLQRNLFIKHPCRYPTYGNKEVIRAITREKIVDYFNKYYVPNNISISVVGDVSKWRKPIEERFKMKKGISPKKFKIIEQKSTKIALAKEKRKIANTYTVLGFKTIPRSHYDSCVFEIINGILGRGQSGRMFTEIRSKRGLAYDVGTQNIGEVSFGYFAVYASIDKKNIYLVRKLILKELQKLQTISEKDLQEAKDFVEGSYLLELEDAQKVADQLLFWEQVGDFKLMEDFLIKIRKVTCLDVQKAAQRYFKKYTMVVLEGK